MSPWRYDEDGSARVAQVDRHGGARKLEAKGVPVKRVRGATGSWWSMIPTAISCSSTVRTRLRPARLLEMKHNPAARQHGRFHGIHSLGSAATAAE
ncbi:MAG: hypothetical protein WB762_31685 [Candidatus Sulfotelmatobacter sp.]